ncbi:Ficolin-1 [Bulinus truncatus]|nr:Ficolin-1 [Bulinus truncatus]
MRTLSVDHSGGFRNYYIASYFCKSCDSIECPKAVVRECNRDLKGFYNRIHVYSKIHRLNYLCDTETDGGGWIIFQLVFLILTPLSCNFCPTPLTPPPCNFCPVPLTPPPYNLCPTPLNPPTFNLCPTPLTPPPCNLCPTPLTPPPFNLCPTPLTPPPCNLCPTPLTPPPCKLCPTPLTPPPCNFCQVPLTHHHRRVNKDTSFDRTWNAYKNGFGQVCEDYWLGNENLHQITKAGRYELRIDMVYQSRPYYALYSDFEIGAESGNYKLHYGTFVTGNVDNMLSGHNGRQFSTPDRDNDISGHHCSKNYQSGWWYFDCHRANLNGIFNDKTFGHGVIWETLTTDYDSLDSVEMKIRPM